MRLHFAVVGVVMATLIYSPWKILAASRLCGCLGGPKHLPSFGVVHVNVILFPFDGHDLIFDREEWG